MRNQNRTTQQAADQHLIDGLEKHQNDIPSLVLGAQTVKNADICSRLKQMIDAATAIAPARTAWRARVTEERSLRADNAQLLDDLRQTLRAMFSTNPETLADFGLAARKRTPRSPKAQVEAAAKAESTRKARGTRGAGQRAAITGDVTGIVVTPVTASGQEATPPAPPAPAPSPAVPAGTPTKQ